MFAKETLAAFKRFISHIHQEMSYICNSLLFL